MAACTHGAPHMQATKTVVATAVDREHILWQRHWLGYKTRRWIGSMELTGGEESNGLPASICTSPRRESYWRRRGSERYPAKSYHIATWKSSSSASRIAGKKTVEASPLLAPRWRLTFRAGLSGIRTEQIFIPPMSLRATLSAAWTGASASVPSAIESRAGGQPGRLSRDSGRPTPA